MVYKCDNCDNTLETEAYTCKGYNYIACSPGCLANLMLIVQKVNTKKFFDEER